MCQGRILFACLFWVVGAAFADGMEDTTHASLELRMDDELFGVSFYLDDHEITRSDLKQILSTDEACEKPLKRGELYGNVSGTAAVLGGSILVYGMGHSIYEREFKTTPVSLGLASLALNFVCFKYLDKKNLKLAIDIFNRRRPGAYLDSNAGYRLTLTKPVF
jgi:hypothetical protein